MAKGTLALSTVKLGDNADTSKNFLIKVPPVADGTLVIERENGTDVLSIDVNGKVTLDPATLLMTNGVPLGYGVGSGGVVTQLTSKSTLVTINEPSGRITMNAGALGAGAIAAFQVNNSTVNADDTVILTINFSANGYNYNAWVWSVSAGAFTIALKNLTAGSLSEAVAINFAVIKGASA